uniref:Predicted protein n=1 Tax=Hordeum vulgare subsp. vulgare TaxID=112509 RepID=F2CQX9_HORVV|nr:predicted protein [Hordeum vulgare subsp. vulgare]BAJ88272.1 predicted protein [Hordeum vulgare subsp. vulgare]BAJ96829.1 predicted protein [Hordeum vulgare subsp. vulgare]BAK00348.1 predicted protein [Hordeum vulgare subsp. vulgare]
MENRAELDIDVSSCRAGRVAARRAVPTDATKMPAEAAVGAFSWLGVAFFTVNLGMAISRSKGDQAAAGFVAFSYLDLALLCYCHRRFESAAPGSPARRRLKVAVWVLTAMLTAVLSYTVAAIMPLPVQILVWAMAAAAVGGGFYALFSFQEEGKDS